MDFFGPHLLGYVIATLHFLGSLAAIHAVLTVRTAQGSIAWALSFDVYALPDADSLPDLWPQHL